MRNLKIGDLTAPSKSHLTELAIFAMLGVIMFISKLIMNALPNVHLIGTLIAVYTLVFRWKALIPIYIYVFLTLFDFGFTLWWVPNLYIWLILWLLIMAIPKKLPLHVGIVICMIVCGLHGLAYGTLWAPVQALLFRLDFNQALMWIVSGLYFDLIHGLSNLALSTLILPLSSALSSAVKRIK